MVNLAYEERIAQLTDIEAARAYVTGGRSYVTVKSVETGKRFTFLVTYPMKHNQIDRDCDKLFVSVLSGPDNTSSYSHIGWIDCNTSEYVHNHRKSQHPLTAECVTAFRYLWWVLSTQKQIPTKFEIWTEGKCGCCGRKLTVPESVARGIGPICAQQYI